MAFYPSPSLIGGMPYIQFVDDRPFHCKRNIAREVMPQERHTEFLVMGNLKIEKKGLVAKQKK